MISVPGSRLPPSAPRPQVAPEYLLMAQAVHERMNPAAEEMPHLKTLEPGEWGNPAELYNTARKHGLSKEDALDIVRKSVGKGMNLPPEEVDEALLEQPGS